MAERVRFRTHRTTDANQARDFCGCGSLPPDPAVEATNQLKLNTIACASLNMKCAVCRNGCLLDVDFAPGQAGVRAAIKKRAFGFPGTGPYNFFYLWWNWHRHGAAILFDDRRRLFDLVGVVNPRIGVIFAPDGAALARGIGPDALEAVQLEFRAGDISRRRQDAANQLQK